MDRSWKDTEENVLENHAMSRWDKFTSGGYTFKNITQRYSKTLTLKQQKIRFLTSQFENLPKIDDE